MPHYQATSEIYSKFINQHIEDDSANLFYRGARKELHIGPDSTVANSHPITADYVFDMAVKKSDCPPNRRLHFNPDYPPKMVKANYRLLLSGEDQIAGRDVYTLSLMPKQRNFPWKQLWVDKKTFYVVASRDWSSQNKIKRSSRTLKTLNSPKGDSFYGCSVPGHVTLKTSPKSSLYVPKGFVLLGIEANADDMHYDFSDGLNSITVFITFNSKPHKTEVSDSGQALVYTKYSGGKKVIVVADLPVEELSKIANSIH